MKTKRALRYEIKDADQGLVEAVFSTLDVVDLDNDVTLKGAFESGAPVAISPYGHGWRQGRPPVGKGTIRETSTEAVMDGQFFLDTAAGLDTFTTVKRLTEDAGPGVEWSYGYDVKDHEFGTKDGKRVRFLKSLDVFEVSPVMLGAGVDTRTLVTKHAKQCDAIKELPGGRTVNELRALLREALDATVNVPADNAWLWIDDFTDEWVLYQLEGSGWDEPGTFQAEYTVDADGVVNLADPVEVEIRAEIVPKAATPAGGAKFAEQAESVLTDLEGLLDRAADVLTKRRNGKLGAESSALLERTEAAVKRLDVVLRAPNPSDEAARELLRAMARDLAAV